MRSCLENGFLGLLPTAVSKLKEIIHVCFPSRYVILYVIDWRPYCDEKQRRQNSMQYVFENLS